MQLNKSIIYSPNITFLMEKVLLLLRPNPSASADGRPPPKHYGCGQRNVLSLAQSGGLKEVLQTNSKAFNSHFFNSIIRF